MRRWDAGDGAWEPTDHQLEDTTYAYALSPSLGVDAAGNAFVVYNQYDEALDVNHAWAVRYSAATDTWGAVERIDSSDTRSVIGPELAMDPMGNALVVWRDDGVDDTIAYSHYDAATGSWDAEQGLVAALDPPRARAPQIAVNDDGDAVVAWREYDGNGDIYAARWDATAGAWDPYASLEVEPGNTGDPYVVVGNDQRVTVVWEQVMVGTQRVIAGIRWDPTLGWDAAPTYADVINAVLSSFARQPDTDSSGNVAVPIAGIGTQMHRAHGTFLNVSTMVWEPPTLLWNDETALTLARAVGVDGNDDALYAFVHQGSVRVRRRRADGTWDTDPVLISSPGISAGGVELVGLDDGWFIVWQQQAPDEMWDLHGAFCSVQ